jgi:predicted dehydrogenase
MHSSAYPRVGQHFPDLGVTPRLIVASDTSSERARSLANRFGYERWSTDWREAIEDPRVAGVSITAPNAMHREMVLAAVGAGKHVWAEKPLGRWPTETEQIVEAVQDAGIACTVGFTYRQAPLVQHAAGSIAAERLGRLTRYRGSFLCDYGSHPDSARTWRFEREQAGLGVLGDLMTHVVDMAHFLVGPIERVLARTDTLIAQRPLPRADSTSHFALASGNTPAPVENEDWAVALVEFADGLAGTLEAGRVVVGPRAEMSFEIHGLDGALAWNFERLNELRCHGGQQADGWCTILAGPEHPDFAGFMPGAGNGMGFADLKVIEARRFLESVRDGVALAPSAADALATARVIAAMVDSADRGAWAEVGRVR